MASAGGRKQINVLNTAVRKLAGRFGASDPALFLEAAASLARDGVCARCLLRLMGHAGLDDYGLPAPSQAEVLAALAPNGDTNGTYTDSAPPAPALCPACFSLLPALLDDQEPPQLPNGTAINACGQGGDTDGTAPTPAVVTAGGERGGEAAEDIAAAATAAAAAVGSAAAQASGGAGVDLAWLRIQQKALPGAAGCRAGPAKGHERLPGWPSAASLAAAVRRHATEGPPDTAALVAAAAAAAAMPAAPPTPPPDGGDAGMAEAETPSAAAAAATAAAAAAPLVPPPDAQLGPPLQLKSFCLELGAVPAASAVRDVAMLAWAVAFCEGRGVACRNWRAADVAPLPTVLRRALPAALSRHLGVHPSGPQSASVTVSVVALDGEEGVQEMRALAAERAAFQRGRRQGDHHQHQQYHRGNKRQRGPMGQLQQQPQAGQQQQEAAQDVERETDGAVGVVPEPSERDRPMSYDQASAAASSLPRHVLTRQFPWPPLPAAKRWALQKQQQQQQTAAAAEEAGKKADAPAEAAADVTAAAAAVDAVAAALPSVHVRAVHAPILLAGRYCKLRRHMPQCPWFVLATGARIGGTSVQEAIEQFVLPLYGTATAKMVTGGREDADVRMLGQGRPFVLEVQAPVRGNPPAEELRRTEQRMRDSNCGVSVQGLMPCQAAALESIKAAEESKEKTYRALCWSERPPTPGDLAALMAAGRVEAAQDTPVRVLHRRAAKIRPKWLRMEAATAVPGQPHYFTLQLRTQAGAYVKEFCHGDFGRCRPSLGDLLGRIQATRDAATASAAGPSVEAEAAAAAAVAAQAKEIQAAAIGVATATAEGTVEAAAAAAAAAIEPKPVHAELPASCGSDGGGGKGNSSAFVRCEIVQLDVIDVHLENWP